MGGSIPEPSRAEERPRSGRVSSVLTVALAALTVAALTALVVLIRAGGDLTQASNWPVNWELRSSDNGVLFQVLQDVVAGRPLDWSFSPQVYVFPELPLSALAFAVTGGNVYAYYVVVAALNNALLFLALVGVGRILFPTDGVRMSAMRAGIATLPLLALPLVGTSWILSFHLAPTYYFGMYLALISAPILLLGRSRGVRVAVGVTLALTVASNPLAAVFAAIGAAAAVILYAVRHGWRAAVRPAIAIGAVLAVALIVRVALFTPLQGTSPLTYIDAKLFADRLAQIWPYYAFEARNPATAVILGLGAALAVLALVAAVVVAVSYLRRREDGDTRMLAVVYLGLVPLGGLATTAVLQITHFLYFWPVLVLPLVFVGLALPRVVVPPAALAGLLALTVLAVLSGALGNLTHVDRYATYANDETRCIDRALPAGVTVGYGTFSDARRLSLTSSTPFRLIPIEPDATPSTWLTNRAYPQLEVGRFFYLNGSGDQATIDPGLLRAEFGAPDLEVGCSATQSVWVYDDPAKLALIARFYGVDEG